MRDSSNRFVSLTQGYKVAGRIGSPITSAVEQYERVPRGRSTLGAVVEVRTHLAYGQESLRRQQQYEERRLQRQPAVEYA